MIDWFRGKAKEFNAIADTLETTFSGANGEPGPQVIAVPSREVSLDSVRKTVLEFGSSRPVNIAESLKATRESVQAVIDNHPEVFEKTGKGWVKVKP